MPVGQVAIWRNEKLVGTMAQRYSISLLALVTVLLISSMWFSITIGTRRYRSANIVMFSARISEGGITIWHFVDRGGQSGWLIPTGIDMGHVPDAPKWKLWFTFQDRSSGVTFSASCAIIPSVQCG